MVFDNKSNCTCIMFELMFLFNTLFNNSELYEKLHYWTKEILTNGQIWFRENIKVETKIQSQSWLNIYPMTEDKVLVNSFAVLKRGHAIPSSHKKLY
jgi:hypothetical protein